MGVARALGLIVTLASESLRRRRPGYPDLQPVVNPDVRAAASARMWMRSNERPIPEGSRLSFRDPIGPLRNSRRRRHHTGGFG